MLNVKKLIAHLLVKAEDVKKIQTGTTGSIAVSASAYTDKAITFSPAFTSTPAMIVSFYTSSTAGTFGRCSVAVSAISRTGATIRVYNGDTGQRSPNVYWTAIGN